jgi:hypothetical protein
VATNAAVAPTVSVYVVVTNGQRVEFRPEDHKGRPESRRLRAQSAAEMFAENNGAAVVSFEAAA